MRNVPGVISLLFVGLLLPTFVVSGTAAGQPQSSERHVLLIGGLGGNDQYSSTFQDYLFETYQAFVDRFEVPEGNITVLAESDAASASFVTDVSTADNIRAQFDRLSGTAGENDQVFIILFGHGSYDGQNAHLNIPRRDLSENDFAQLTASLEVDRTIFINTANSSGPFIEALSGSDRIVITATRSGRQANEPMFPRFLVEAFSDPTADLDQDDRLSVREAFQYAARKTAQSFSEEGHVVSEHALLEDTGDGSAVQLDELGDSSEGSFAATTYFHSPRTAVEPMAELDSDSLETHRAQKRELERKIATLKSQKDRMTEKEYYSRLEELLVQLARLSQSSDTEN